MTLLQAHASRRHIIADAKRLRFLKPYGDLAIYSSALKVVQGRENRARPGRAVPRSTKTARTSRLPRSHPVCAEGTILPAARMIPKFGHFRRFSYGGNSQRKWRTLETSAYERASRL